MNKFEQLASDVDQISLAGGPCTMRSHGQGHGDQGAGPCTVRSNASWVMITWDYMFCERTDRHDWAHYLPVTLLAFTLCECTLGSRCDCT